MVEKTSETSVEVPEPYPWQLEQWKIFVRQVEAARLPHALLLSGESETGKLEFARAAAAYVLCQKPSSLNFDRAATGACGRCSSCSLYSAGSHPDLLLLRPEEPGKQLRIDAIRGLNEFSSMRAHQGGWKVVLMEPAEALNINAANALLKTLEEPGRDTLLILVSHRSDSLLATIRSRCQVINFARPAEELVAPWLHGALDYCLEDSEANLRVREVLTRAEHRPLRALRYSEEQAAANIDEFEQVIEKLANGGLSPIQAAELCYQLEFNEALNWFTRIHLQQLRAQINSGKRPVLGLLSFNDRLAWAARLLSSPANLNKQLVWEELLMDWKRALVTVS